MVIKQVAVGAMLNFAYIVGDKDSGEGMVIDPSWEPEKVFDIARKNGIVIKYIVNTHCHEDHVNGNKKMKELSGALLAIHEAETKYLKHFFPPEADIKLSEGGTIKIGKLSADVIHTPGHSPGSICIRVGNNLFTGDTLFVGGCGRTDLPGGDNSQFNKTINRLKELNDDVTVHPGHNYGDSVVSTIGREKLVNPCFLRA